MIFWDSSALVALLVDEAETAVRIALLENDSVMIVWWAIPVECESALQRRIRDGSLDSAAIRPARERLALLSETWREARSTAAVPKLAPRLLRTHSLRAADCSSARGRPRSCWCRPL